MGNGQYFTVRFIAEDRSPFEFQQTTNRVFPYALHHFDKYSYTNSKCLITL